MHALSWEICDFTLATSKPKRLVQNDKARNTIKTSSTAKFGACITSAHIGLDVSEKLARER